MDRRAPRRRRGACRLRQAKLTGRLAVCCGTTGPGSTHLVAGLYEASRDHAPVLAISGDMPRKMHGTDFIQTTEPDLLFRDVSLYTETISSPAQAPAVIHQAIAAAYAGRGVAHLTIPQDVFEAKADGAVSSVATLKPRPEIVPNEDGHCRNRPPHRCGRQRRIMCGAGCHGAAEELRALSDRLKAPLIHSVKGKEIMPYDDPRWMGGIGMIGTKAVYNAMMHCDLLLMLGTDYPYSEFLPHKGTVDPGRRRARVLGRRTPTALGIVGSVRPDIEASARAGRRQERHQILGPGDQASAGKWDEMLDKQSDPARSMDRIHPQAVARGGQRSRQDPTRSSSSTPGSTPYGRPTGSGRADRSGSSARSTMPRSERRSVRPTASRRSTARARSSRCAAMAASTC